ncbi:response regulator [Cognatishimia sp. SS12]|uniref:response regulator n=1 Tax=Cognatishimia sp. SS12 TaxID=2979465 RepID=UPI0023305065|nr:response regulator [Cognatishimia sp. SS12]MDC0739427.1 response regulator [Cognatishimia sp. SS12]
MRILAVDDDENIRELLSASIAAETSHYITTVPSAQKALAVAGHVDPEFDCFLLDIQMPGMDGIELCQRLRQMSAYQKTPILMLTAMAQKKFVDRAFQAGATDYISKPFEFLELFSRLKNAERLIEEQSQTQRRRAEINSLKHDLARSVEHSLSEPVEILGIERVVGYVSFENYLLQLSRMRMLLTSVLAIKILNVEKIFRNMSRVEFRTLLGDISQLLAQDYGSDGDLVTYRGNGVFAIASSSRKPFSQFELEKALNRKLRDLRSVQDAEHPIQICAGEPVSLISLTRAGSLTSLQNAVARVEARSDSYHKILKMSATRRSLEAANTQDMQDRHIYETLLKQEIEDRKSVANS